MKHYLVAYQRGPGGLGKVMHTVMTVESVSEVVETVAVCVPDAYADNPIILAIVEIHPV